MNIPDIMPDSEILTREEGAAFLRVSQPTFDNLYKSGRLPYIKCGKSPRFRRSDILSLAQPESKPALTIIKRRF